MSHWPQLSALSRRRLLAVALVEAGLLSLPALALAARTQDLRVDNVTGLHAVRVARIETPRTTAQVSALVSAWRGKVGIGGARFSMGGQIAVEGGLHLDMRQMNAVLWLKPRERVVRVQAGLRWRDLQDRLDPVGLAVKTMQSFSNFSVGGSVSVNAHGRYVGHGPVGRTVRALQLVLADGRVVETSRSERPDLFRAALGGYGAIGVITEVELDVAENVKIERLVEPVALADYPAHFHARVLQDPRAVLHNADLLPPAFDAPVATTWRRADAATPLTERAPLIPRDRRYGLEQNVIWSVTELPGGARVRTDLQSMLNARPAVVWLNHEASLDVAELEPRTRAMSTYVLQEYFVPERHFLAFARELARILRRHTVNALNVSIRHSPADPDALMAWAREDVFSFVLYYKQRTWTAAQEQVGRWTRELIDAVLRHEGRYYLPYQPHATREQFQRAYPEAAALRRLKDEVDPAWKFSNELWRKYL
ncbi:FAD-binding oxidoreductase [Roseateles noduli]|nr:FAD-binding oxidoreductase [Roseateles noduli]